MKKSRFSEEQIMGFLRHENTKLKRLLAEAHLDIHALQSVLRVKHQPHRWGVKPSDRRLNSITYQSGAPTAF